MLGKLALGNVKKSLRDYAVYFITLTFGVCLFYVFNSIESQQAMLRISADQRDILQMLAGVMGYVSVFISVILAFLILYANTFLMKRRKKEMGVYLTLGMRRGKISQILMLETLLIGVFSLAVGLALGLVGSHGLSIITAGLFESSLEGFRFVFSIPAFFKTLAYFGLIFLLVMVFNLLSVSRIKLIDMLYASKKSERPPVGKIKLSVIWFLLSVICLGAAYQMISINGMMRLDLLFTGAIVLGSFGTLLFFLSLSGFLLQIVRRWKRVYYKELNIFVMRQLSSRVTTAYVSMTLICLMLLLSIGAISCGVGMAKAIESNQRDSMPFDATVQIYGEYDPEAEESLPIQPIGQLLREKGVDASQFADKWAEMGVYTSETQLSDMLPEILSQPDVYNIYFQSCKVSEFNAVRELRGADPISLESGQYALFCTVADAEELMQRAADANAPLTFKGATYDKCVGLYSEALSTSNGPSYDAMIVLPDEALSGEEPMYRLWNVMYPSGENHDQEMRDLFQILELEMGMSIRQSILNENVGLKTLASYLGIYIGVVFLITSAAVLGIQQLSEASDNAKRYELLRKIGAEKRLVNRALLRQIAIYFALPLGLAVVHSVVGVSVANRVISMMGKLQAGPTILFTACFIVAIYGGYFLATYLGSRSTVKSSWAMREQ